MDQLCDLLLREKADLKIQMSVLLFAFGLPILRDQHYGRGDQGTECKHPSSISNGGGSKDAM
jgi:hypothetical protein